MIVYAMDKHVCCYLIWYNTPLNAALLVQKRKPETEPRVLRTAQTRVSDLAKCTGFPGGFFKTRVSIPTVHIPTCW